MHWLNRDSELQYSPCTMLKNKKIWYKTKKYPTNGLRERQRRIRQMLKEKI